MSSKGRVKLRRLLSREVDIRPVEADDVRYFYAGYKQGAFDEYIKPRKDMNPAEFQEFIVEYADTAYLLYTGTVNGSPPLCVGHTTVADNRMECHINWMPWATPRNKMEVIAKFLKAMNDSYTIMTVVSEKNKDTLFHIRRYGLMRFVGKIYKYFDTEVGYAFQGV